MSTATTGTQTSNSEDYRVPNEPGVYFCARHKNTKTRLRCGRCEKPICPKCTKYGPTGARCPDCASNRDSHMYQVSPLQFLIAFGVAFGCSIIGGFLSGFIGIFFLLFYAPVVGTLVGKAIVRVVKGKRGTPLALVAAAGVVLGALVPLANSLLKTPPEFQVMNPLVGVAIYIALAISGVWYWLK
jgi:hypothetical protein